MCASGSGRSWELQPGIRVRGGVPRPEMRLNGGAEITAVLCTRSLSAGREVTKRGRVWNLSQGLFQQFRKQNKTASQGNSLPGNPSPQHPIGGSFLLFPTFGPSLRPLLVFSRPDCIGASEREVALLLNVRGGVTRAGPDALTFESRTRALLRRPRVSAHPCPIGSEQINPLTCEV